MKRGERRSGFTLIELMIALALLGIVMVKLTMVMNDASKSQRHETASMALEDNARRVLDRVSYALLGAARDTLRPSNEIPSFDSTLDYRISLGMENGALVWSDPERVGLSKDDRQVVWKQNPDMANERSVVWCNTVRPFLDKELPNGIDDNVNGLTDEKGLSFALDGDSITIRLTLEQPSKSGPMTKTVETTVTCRN